MKPDSINKNEYIDKFDISVKDEVIDWLPQNLAKTFARYTQNSYYEAINQALRTGYTDDLAAIYDIESLDKLFTLVPNKLKNKQPIVVYRGAKLTDELNQILQKKTGTDVYTEKAYASTSRNKQVAKRFAMQPQNIIFEITIPINSTFIEDSMLPSYARSKMSGEEEVLLPRNAQFKITNYNPKTRIVEVTYLGQKQPLEIPQFYKISAQDALAQMNKNSLWSDKINLIDKELKNKI